MTWGKLPADAATITGPYKVQGTVTGSSLPAVANVSVYDVSSIATSSTVTPTGSAPLLPATVRVLYTDGVDASLPVTWAPITPAQYANAGTFAVEGTIDGVTQKARATVRVTDAVTHDQNLARSTSGTLPTADASYSSSAPAGMLDGTTTTGGWSNAQSGSQSINLLDQ